MVCMHVKLFCVVIFVENFGVVTTIGASQASSPVHTQPNQLDLLGGPKSNAPSSSTNGL